MLFRRSNTLTLFFTLMAIVSIVIMFFLGFWQLDRKSIKEQRLEQIEQRKDANILNVREVISDPAAFVDFSVSINGVINGRIFYIDNRLKDGVAGYEILMPVTSDYGTALVNLGWLAGTGNRSELPSMTLPNKNEFTGVLYMPSDNVMISETNDRYGHFPALLQQIDFVEIEKHLASDVLPFTLRLSAEENSQFIRDWQVVVMAPERHLGYAIQWFGLGIAGLTIFLITILKSMQGR